MPDEEEGRVDEAFGKVQKRVTSTHELQVTKMQKIKARILWPALGFPEVIAPKSAVSVINGTNCIELLLLADTGDLSSKDVERFLRYVPWPLRRYRYLAADPEVCSFLARDIEVKAVEPRKEDDRVQQVMFASGHIVANLAKFVRKFYADAGLKHLYQVRIFEQASSNLDKPLYNLFWNDLNKIAKPVAGAWDISAEMDLLKKQFFDKRHARGKLAPIPEEYEYEHSKKREDENRTEVLHPLFVLDKALESIRIGHITDTHICIRANVFERNLSKANVPAKQYNNYNSRFSELYGKAKSTSDVLMLTGDIIDYGCGHKGGSEPLGKQSSFLLDRNWILFYSLLASGETYQKPTYTVLGNHDWNLYPYPPVGVFFSIGKDMNITNKQTKVLNGKNYNLLYYDDKKHVHHPLVMNIESVKWYLLLINPFLDYSAPFPGGYRFLMLDWGEDVELFRRSPGEGIVLVPGLPNASECLTPLQKSIVEWFVEVYPPDKAKVLGLHAAIVGPRPFMPNDSLTRGVLDPCPFCNGEGNLDCACLRFGSAMPQTIGHAVYPVLAFNKPPKEITPTPKTLMPLHGTIKRSRDWLINTLRKKGETVGPVSLVLSGHAHRNSVFIIVDTGNFLVGRPPEGHQVIHAHDNVIDVSLVSASGKCKVGGCVPPTTAVRIEDPKIFPLRERKVRPLFVNTTSAGPMGDDRPTKGKSLKFPPGYTEVTLSSNGTVEAIEHKKSNLKLFHWECWIKKKTKAIWVKLEGDGIKAGFGRPEFADEEREKGTDVPEPIQGWVAYGKSDIHTKIEWSCWIKKPSGATDVKKYNGGIIGKYESLQEAEADAEEDEPWQKWP